MSMEMRLARLESRFRALIGLVIGAAFVVAIAIGVLLLRSDLTGGSLTIRDPHHRLVAQLGGAAGRSFLLYDSNGRVRTIVEIGQSGPTLGMLDELGNERIAIVGDPLHSAILLRDSFGKIRVRLEIEGGEPRFQLLEADGSVLFEEPRQ